MSIGADIPPAGAAPGTDDAIGTAADAHGAARTEGPVLGTEIDPHPLREILRVAGPSVATMTSYTLMTFVDALMVSRIAPSDPIYLAAQGNGGISAWLPQ